MVQAFTVVITLLLSGVVPQDAHFEVEVTCTNTVEGTQSVEFGPAGGTDDLVFQGTAPFSDIDCTVTQTDAAGALAVTITPDQFSPGEPPSNVVEVIVRNTFPEPPVPGEPVTPVTPVEVEPAFTG